MSKRQFFLFARLNLIAHTSDKDEYLLESLSKGVYLSERRDPRSNWGVFDVRKIEYSGNEYLHGFLVRFKEREEETVDRNKGVLGVKKMPDVVEGKSPFFLHLRTGLIAFKQHLRITPNQFCTKLAELIALANDYLFVNPSIYMIQEEHKILTEIKKFDKVVKVSVELHPSNPRYRDRWKPIDEKLRKMEAQKAKFEYTNDEGLKLNEDNESMADIYMAGDGYGEAVIHGFKDGKRRTISTSKQPIRCYVDNDDVDMQLENINKEIKAIEERILNEKEGHTTS